MPSGTRPLPGPLSHAVARILGETLAAQSRAQADVAERAGMSPSQFSRALAGKKVFTLDQLDAVCVELGQPIESVVERASREIHPRLRLVSDERDSLPAIQHNAPPARHAAKRGRKHTEEP